MSGELQEDMEVEVAVSNNADLVNTYEFSSLLIIK